MFITPITSHPAPPDPMERKKFTKKKFKQAKSHFHFSPILQINSPVILNKTFSSFASTFRKVGI